MWEPVVPISTNGHRSVSLATSPTISLDELLERHDIISTEGSIVVQPKQLAVMDRPNYREYGVSGSTSWGYLANREYDPDLKGQIGLRRYEQMRRNDGMVSGVLALRKTPVLAARWYLEPASSSKRDKKVAEFIWDCLSKRMSVSWPRFLFEAMLHLDYGYYAFEKVFVRDDGKIIWRKFAPRHPYDCVEFAYDSHGGPNGLWVNINSDVATPFAGSPFATSSNRHGSRPGEQFIPIEKLLVFTHMQEGGSLEGMSLLRPLHKHHFIKDVLYKIDSIQKERHGIGIPVIVLPPNPTPEDKRLAEQMGRNLRTNEKAHVVLPSMWALSMLKLEGQLVNPIESANHHNSMILAGVLAQFLEGTQSGSVDALVDLFMKVTRSDAEVVRDTINKWAIPELVKWNYGRNVEPPTLEVRRIGEIEDQRTLSFALRNLVGANLLQPDEPLRNAVRKEFDLPTVDPETAFAALAPQAPQALPGGPQAPGTPQRQGPPAQAQAQNMRKAPGKSNTGQDKSGG